MLSTAQYPFTCIRHIGGTIVASAGPNIYSFSASDGRKISTWPELKPNDSAKAGTNDDNTESSEGPPEKKRKLSSTGTEKDEQANGKDNKFSATWLSVPILVPSPSGRYVVAVTAEDKHVRVFELNSEGVLTESSDRPVPRRPCAVAFSSDGNTIICADKGGDVYSMPLLPGESGEFELVSRAKKPSKPAANPLVVHTKRNLDALRQQLRQKQAQDNTPANPTAKRDVLSGHVSTLTDMVYAVVPSSTSASGSHSYILTADRDEQIRVSRGPPQTHVIEAFCLGHESFISTLCIPPTLPHLLVSGGGDNSIFVWDWRNGQSLYKLSVLPEGKNQIVVRDIWAVKIAGNSSVAIFVALDGSRELLSFLLEDSGNILPQESIQASGNVLDLTYLDENNMIFVSIDSCHEPGSIKDWKKDSDESPVLVEGYTVKVKDGKLVLDSVANQAVNNINAQGTAKVLAGVDESSWPKSQKAFSERLYSLQNLRKRTTGDGR
ncbi:tRNA methyltransferase, putative [Talaromyces stipitatus ATCC 10500]|uniref:tRNA methyltransferase, putative n=1 Tax=Talaromyces stipitatus (strain ATCC 10500 / CBS 375.48 / QM 6759 / NRRL 1006) TaxID=441959 RepID=B8MH36_TALSN|nr:tRNA methyltransferase, putative [Talaromyces stipitatus ATCC 10500]EED16850.1 tRNA methyltransferase, putative [Talaromyces stipitatus ATCC 10500]